MNIALQQLEEKYNEHEQRLNLMDNTLKDTKVILVKLCDNMETGFGVLRLMLDTSIIKTDKLLKQKEKRNWFGIVSCAIISGGVVGGFLLF